MSEKGQWSVRAPEAKTRLVRNHDMIHLARCKRVQQMNVLPWEWAEGKSRDEVASTRAGGLHFCRSCDPLLDLLVNHGH